METATAATTDSATKYWYKGAHVINLTEEQILRVVTNTAVNPIALLLGALTVWMSWRLIHINPNDYFRFSHYSYGVAMLIVLFVSYAVAIAYAVKENAMDISAFATLAFDKTVDKQVRDRLQFKFMFDLMQTLVSFIPGIAFPEQFGMWSMIFGLCAFVIGEWIEHKIFGMNFGTYHAMVRLHNNKLMAIGMLFAISQIGFLAAAYNKYDTWYVSISAEEKYMDKVDIYFHDEPMPAAQTNWEITSVDAETYGTKGLAATPDGKNYYYIRFTATGKFHIPETGKDAGSMEIVLFTNFKLLTEVNILRVMRENKAELVEGTVMNQSGAGEIATCDKILLFRKFGKASPRNGIRQNTDIFN